MVHSGNIQDRDGAKLLLEGAKYFIDNLKIIWADGGYAGKLIEWVEKKIGIVLEIVKRSDKEKGFKVLPHRWIVERTFAWLGRYRRMSKDYEFNTDTSENMIYLCMIHIMLRRLAR